jgi:hypothetical protein
MEGCYKMLQPTRRLPDPRDPPGPASLIVNLREDEGP